MNLRTSNIILINKGHHNYLDDKGNKIEGKDVIKRYMSIICGCPEEDYTEAKLTDIIKEIVLDYISTADKPDSFLRDYFNWSSFIKERQFFKDSCYQSQNDNDAWLSALCLIPVRDNNGYINGFNDYNIVARDENTAGETLLFPAKV